MKAQATFFSQMLDWDSPQSAVDVLRLAGKPRAVERAKDHAVIQIPFHALAKQGAFLKPVAGVPVKTIALHARAYGSCVVRLSIAFNGRHPVQDSEMLRWDRRLKPEPLKIKKTADGWILADSRGDPRLTLATREPPVKPWSNLVEAPLSVLRATVFPDGQTAVPFMSDDLFLPGLHDSMPLAYRERDGKGLGTLFSLHAEPGEHFAGTGERFASMDLSGRTFYLENTDALGSNSRRCYKNIPFFLSSRPYGLFIHTSAPIRLSLADLSTQAAQAMVEDDVLDLFFIGGGCPAEILRNYRRITGFPPQVPAWSYGVWMSRMTYKSAGEVRTVARKLRTGKFPCDVLHIDTGWFENDWVCDWKFGPSHFPDPRKFIRDLKDRGFRISLWQLPYVSPKVSFFERVKAERFIAPYGRTSVSSASSVSGNECGGTIDFTYPPAVRWYRGMLEKLLRLGVANIKADFGEHIDMDAEYRNRSSHFLRNLYALLYQKAVFGVTKTVRGEGLIWARSAWAGSQRYPVHWAGDPACSWDGLAGTIRGGLHLGLSGFGYWSHDVPGFHGVPDFMNSRPPDDLYVRWTQVGVFTSHLRYHGSSPREPYEYSEIADLVRSWWNLRYALIPYLTDQGKKITRSGLPIFRALVFHHADDPVCWNIDDQFYCGDTFLVAPVLNGRGVRDVYLPAGSWTDFWTGEIIRGPKRLKDVRSPLARLPVFAVTGATIRVYPRRVQCTDEMDPAGVRTLSFDADYRGLSKSLLGATMTCCTRSS